MLFAFLHFHHIPLDWGGCLICPSLQFLCVKIAEESIMWTFMLIWGTGRKGRRAWSKSLQKWLWEARRGVMLEMANRPLCSSHLARKVHASAVFSGIFCDCCM